MPITKKAKSALPKGACALNSSTPKRPANSPPCSPSEIENAKRNKIHISPQSAPSLKPSKKGPLSSKAPAKPVSTCKAPAKPAPTNKAPAKPASNNKASAKPAPNLKAPAKPAPRSTAATKPPVLKSTTIRKTKTTATTSTQRAPLYSAVVSPPSGSKTPGHNTQAQTQFVVNHWRDTQSGVRPFDYQKQKEPTPIPAPRPSLPAPSSTHQPTQDTHTNSFYIDFDLKYWKSETEVLIALNSEYPFLTYNIKGKLGQSVSITVNNLESFTVFASLKNLNKKPISFVPKQPFTPSIQSVISNVPATVSAKSFLSIINIVSAERMFSWSQSLKSKVPTTNIKVVYRAFALPYNIKLGAFVYDIRPFVPAPVQCKQCCQFGHSSYVCNSEHQVCSICSGSHFFKQCPTPNARKCPNCSLPHSANWGGCPARKKAAQIIINSVKPVPLMSLKITPPPHVRKPFITVTSPRNPNPYWPEARPPTVTSARKPTNIAPKQPTFLRSQDSQTDNTTTKQPNPVINQSSQTHDTLTPEQPTSLSNQSTQTVITPAKKPDKDITTDSTDYSLQMIDYIQFTIAPHNEDPESYFARIFKPLAEALDISAFNIDPENSTSLKHCQANIQQLIFLMHQTLQVLGVFDD